MIYGDSRNILLNFKLLLDSTFLRDGHFVNVSLGQTVRGVDVSRLYRDYGSDNYFAGVSGAQVWQSPYQEWVYESGITMNNAPYISGMTPPIVSSGIYVNGSFFSQAGGVSGNQFYIDYINGRIIFIGSGIPSTSVVKAEYAYRSFRVEIANSNTRSDVAYFAETELKDNPFSNQNELYPSGGYMVGTIPAVFLEIGEVDQTAYELGNRSAILDIPIECHVFTYNTLDRDSALDLIRTRWRIHMPLIDFNYAPLPLSGIYATLSPEYIPYQTLLENPVHRGNNVISKHFYIENLRTRPLDPLLKLERGVAFAQAKLYNIAPTGRISQNPYI